MFSPPSFSRHLSQVRREFGKRLVILVTELDTGRERQLTPESDADLPVRVAVRMSMGVPGLVEPYRYQNHLYVDGGMCNDFPLNALPDDGRRLGLMVRPREWVLYNIGPLDAMVQSGDSARPLSQHQELIFRELRRMEGRIRRQGIYPVRDPLELIMTSVQVIPKKGGEGPRAHYDLST